MLRLILKLAYAFITFVETLLVLRILISVFLSNSTHVFIEWIINFTNTFISPFEGIGPSSLVINDTEIALTPIIALVFFAIVAFVLSELIRSFRRD